jgi:hypothetical protein
MNNQPRNLANKLTEAENNNNNNDDDEETMSAAPLDGEEPNEEEAKEEEPSEEEKETIKSVALTGKDAANLNQNKNNPTKNAVPIGSVNSNGNNNNLTKKKNNNPVRNLTQKQNTNLRVATEESETANTGDKNIMRSLNKVAMNLLNHQIVMKLFHFQTELYGAHKASDSYLEKFAATMDKFLEIAQGIYGRLTIKKFKLEGSSHTDENIMKHIEGIITLLRTRIDDVLDNYTDLINVRDELVGDAEQLKYLLSFK